MLSRNQLPGSLDLEFLKRYVRRLSEFQLNQRQAEKAMKFIKALA